jgi:hypothetical protein
MRKARLIGCGSQTVRCGALVAGDRLQRLLAHAKEQHYYTLPWPVADYDSCPSGLDG